MIEILKQYLGKRWDLIKLEATEKGSKVSGLLVIYGLIAILGFFFIILLNVGLALLIGYWIGNYAYGVLILAGIYLLLILILFLARKSIKKSIANKIIKSIYQ